MALLSTLLVGQSGLAAADAGIQATSQNVSNALTPGYSRRTASQSLASPVVYDGLMLGQGARVDAMTRGTDRILTMRRLAEAGGMASASQLHNGLSLVESSFNEANADSLRDLFDGAFSSMDALTLDPSSDIARTNVLDAFEQLTGQVNATFGQLQAAQRGFEENISNQLDGVNDQLEEVADLNRRIIAAGGDTVAPDLADRRDLLLRSLSETVGATAQLSPDGGAVVMIGGHAVVNGIDARTLSLETSPDGPPSLQISTGDSAIDITSSASGAVGGLLTAWDNTESYQNDLNTFVASFADAANGVHQAGYDATGDNGRQLFSYDASDPAATFALNEDIVGRPERLALSSSPDDELVGNMDNLLNLMALRDDTSLSPTGETFGDMLTNLSARVGRDVNSAERALTQQAAVVQDLDTLANNLQGVDLDEEAANLLSYQAAYQAAARVMSTADAMLGTLMELV